MRWYRSELDRDSHPPAVLHFFLCPHCSRIGQARTAAREGDAPPPSRLSRPAGQGAPVVQDALAPPRQQRILSHCSTTALTQFVVASFICFTAFCAD